MENILLPAVVAGAVFVVFLFVLLKSTSGGESNRKKALIGQMMEDTKASNLGRQDVNLFKDTPGAGTFLNKIPGITHSYDLLISAGLWEKRGLFFGASLFLFIFVALALRNAGTGAAIVIGLLIAYFIPHKYLTYKINKRNQKFMDMFPDAIDLITRSVRSGHPINTAMRMISENMEPPVRDEFKQVTDEVSYGRTLTEALKRMSARLKIPDVDFFVVVLSVQQETGGSLTEVLSNLSNIIRKRKQLRAKIHAMTSEGRATAYILGAIPVLEFGVLYFITPSYLEPLFTTFDGNCILACAVALIIASQIVIRRMIDIDI